MGNVAKYLCPHERETIPDGQIKGILIGKSGNIKISEERLKLKALSCLSPMRGNLEKENENENKKSCNHKPCIQDYILYSVFTS